MTIFHGLLWAIWLAFFINIFRAKSGNKAYAVAGLASYSCILASMYVVYG